MTARFIASRLEHGGTNEGILNQLPALKKFDGAAMLETLKARTLIIHAEDDGVVPFGNLGVMKRIKPDAQTHVFKDAGHFFFVGQGLRTVEAVDAFLGPANEDPPPQPK